MENNYNLKKIQIKKNYLENEMENIYKQLDNYNSLLKEIITKHPNINEKYVMDLLSLIKELNSQKHNLTIKIMEL
ncbi:hypothetical protein A9X74_10800 [Brachyspira hyodysenteriae]|nr:hypothetical protein BH718_00500 [Brachyspira hyodysenteriae]TVL69248.1 hypothetical protein A9X74_10800 [Brachyspira hyodysenteriae]